MILQQTTPGPPKWVPPTRSVFFLPYQVRWYRDRSPVKIYAKSRRVGITWTTAYEAIEVASKVKRDGGMDVYFMTTSKDDARLFVDDCVKWIKRITPALDDVIDASDIQKSDDWFKDEEGEKILAFRIDFPSGWTIYALSSRPTRLRGKEGFVIIDEAAHLDLDTAITAASGSLTWGGRIAIISTYNGEDNAFYRRVQRARVDKASGSLHELNIYEALEQGLFRRICAVNHRQWSEEAQAAWLAQQRAIDPAGFPEEYECIVGGSGRQLYARADAMRCMQLDATESVIIEIRGGDLPKMWVANEIVQGAPISWEGDDDEAMTPAERRDELQSWLDRHLVGELERINATKLDVYVGGDYGRKINPSCIVLGTVDRSMRRRILLKLEFENMRWEMQDQVLDYCWAHLRRIKAGCTDGNGPGGPSAERAQRRTGGKVKAVIPTTKWNEFAHRRLGDRISDQGIWVSKEDSMFLADMCSFKRVKGKIVSSQRVTADERKQKRHGETAVALAMFEESVGLDGPDTMQAKPPRQSGRRSRRRASRGRR